MKFYCFILTLGLFLNSQAQDTYTSLTQTALKTMWKARGDQVQLQIALDLYEDAFARFPDSIDPLGLYKSSVLAGQLGDLDKAFKYLTPLSETNGTFPGWNYIVGEYASSEYENLLEDPRWKTLEVKALAKRKAFFDNLAQKEREFLDRKEWDISNETNGKRLYQKLRMAHPYLPKQHQNYSISLPINDSIKTAYFVHLPPNYSPDKKYPVLVFLHGAVRSNGLVDYMDEEILGGWNRFYPLYGDQQEVILVFPKGNRQFNWMKPDDGFFMVPQIVRQVKKVLNIEDNQVFVSGHSNGATGSFSYLIKAPTLFAGLYGFNTYPKVFTGGTFVKNAFNRSFTSFSTDRDYYYPPQAHDQMVHIMDSLGLVYQDYRFEGYPHWFPEFDESEEAYQILFKDLLNRERNPFPNPIYWELDDLNHGEVDWLKITKLDTLKEKKDWHVAINFSIKEWLQYNDNKELVPIKVNQPAFDFPRKSGAIRANVKDNIFRIETSRIKSVDLFISPEMVDLTRTVRVYLNGKLQFDDLIDYDIPFMKKWFSENWDRTQIWVNVISLEIK